MFVGSRAHFGAFFLFGSVAFAARDGLCPPLGPVIPAPTNLSAHDSVHAAFQIITNGFQNITSSFNKTGPILELHHTPPVLDTNRGASVIGSETIYRIGSISKIFAVLSVLTQGQMKLEDPITKYVPELRDFMSEAVPEANNITAVNWDQVTAGSLRTHMSSIGASRRNSPASSACQTYKTHRKQDAQAFSVSCPPCTRAEFCQDFGKRHPVYAPWKSAVYSNVASSILGFAVESATKIKYDAYVEKAILSPLGMTNTTFFSAPKDESCGFIPQSDTWFGSSLGYEDIAGGFYSNTKDMLALGLGILQNRLLDNATTRSWMKPGASISSPDFALTAIVTTLLPAVEDANKAEVEAIFGSRYVDHATNFIIALFLDHGPGLAVSECGCLSVRCAVFNVGTLEQIAEGDARRFWSGEWGACRSWASMNRLAYGFKSIDEFIFSVEGGKADSVNLPAFGVPSLTQTMWGADGG
ncbi:beta-lactamase/transpeptidase-like protein [Xylaria nigripes]|nr:beta-lactamase/transpeptidase-like protein [Xylaria nigripes]